MWVRSRLLVQYKMRGVVRTLAGCSTLGVCHHLIYSHFGEIAKHFLQPGGFACTRKQEELGTRAGSACQTHDHNMCHQHIKA